MVSFRSRVRGFFHTKKERALPRRSAKPAIGSRIICGELRMSVQAGMSHELWYWLLSQGWRELTFRPDRRNYRDVPSAWVTWLIDASPEMRLQVLESGIAKATHRSRHGDLDRTRSQVKDA